MLAAKDRLASVPSHRALLSWGWVTLASLSLTGCAEIKTQIFGNERIAELGSIHDPQDVYVKNSQPRVLMPPPGTTLDNGTLPPGSVVTTVQEAGPFRLPAPPSSTSVKPVPSNVSGVVLQSPSPVDLPDNVKLTAANVPGVPNAARLLASAEPRTDRQPSDIVAEARQALETLSTYEVSIRRQERVGNTLQPEEDVLLAIRRSPRAVRLSWPSGTNQGREVLYRADEPGAQLHIKMANPALPRLSLNPESPLVMKNSRHPITEAGFDSLVEGLENSVRLNAVNYAGVETPDGLDHPAHCLTRTTPSGEKWRVYLDTTSHLPSLVLAVDAQGNLVERYVFTNVKVNPPELVSNDAFDTNTRWGAPKGLFGRLARSNNEPAATPTTDPAASAETPH